MMRTGCGAAWITVVAMLMASGCGGAGDPAPVAPPETPAHTPPTPPPPQAPAEVATRTVSGSVIVSYHSGSGEVVDVPADLTTIVVAALVPTADGYRVIGGTGDPSGTFRVDAVPEGEFVLQLGQQYYSTSASDLDGGVDLFGRAQAANAAPGATIAFDVGGLEPFSEGDTVYAVSPEISNFTSRFSLAPDETRLTGTWAFADLFDLDTAIDGSLGDRLLLLQMTSRSFDTNLNTYTALTRAMVTNAPTLTSGSAALSGTLSPLPVETLQTQILYLDLARAAGPPAAEELGRVRHEETVTHSIEVTAMPGTISRGAWGPPVTYAADGGQLDPYDDGARTLHYGVLGDGWAQYAAAETRMSLRYRVDPAMLDGRITYGARVVDSPLAFAGATVGPRISTPRDVRVGSADFSTCITGGGTTPLLTWSAPELGSASWYELEIWELFASADLTRRARGPLLVTASRAIRVPQGVLVAGHSYVFELRALSVPGVDRRTQLRRRSFPLSEASVLSGIFVP